MAEASDEAVIEEWVDRARAPDVFDAIVARINAAITAQVPVFQSDPGLVLDLADNTRGQVEAFLSFAAGRPVEGPWGATALARSFARRGIELEQFLRVYRIGLSSGQQILAGTVAPDSDVPPLPAAVAVQMITRAGEWMDRAVEQLSAAYAEERKRWLAGELTRRAEVVHGILRGAVTDAERARAALGHPLHLAQTALTVWSVGETVPVGVFDSVAQRLSTTLGAASWLTVPASERGAWLWFAGTLPDPAALVSSVDRALTGAGAELRAGVGIPAPGLAGFRRSHEEALAAQRLATRAARTDAVTAYAEVELVSLLSADEAAMRAFVARELGRLTGDDADSARLRETLLASLLHGPIAAARVLNVHKNTVRYRIAQAEDMLGRPTADRGTELILALRCVDYFGPGLLRQLHG